MPKNKKNIKAPTTPEVVEPSNTPELIKIKAQDAGDALIIYGDNPLELSLPDQMSEADYLAYGVNIGRAMEFASWRVGDFVNFGLLKFGYKDYEKLAGITGLSAQYLKDCSSVAARVVPTLRGVASMERAKFMLRCKNDKESVEHAFKRLAPKTTAELRTLTSGAGSRSSSKKKPAAALDSNDVYQLIADLAKVLNEFPKQKWSLLAGLEFAQDDTKSQLAALVGEAQAMLDALTDLNAEGKTSVIAK